MTIQKTYSIFAAGLIALALMLGSAQFASAVHMADDLVGYWNLDTDASEPVHSLTGVVNGDTAFVADSPGIVIGSDGHASFDGDGDYISVADSADLDITEELSISFWFRLDGNSGDNNFPRAVSKGQST